MKNLKINNEWFKRTVCTTLVLASLGTLSGCSSKNAEVDNEDVYENSKLEKVVSNNRIITINDLKLKNVDTNEIIGIDGIEAILIDNKLVREFNLVKIMFDSSVVSILVNDQFIPVDKLGLFNSVTNQNVDALNYIVIEDELIPVDEYFANLVKEETEETTEKKDE